MGYNDEVKIEQHFGLNSGESHAIKLVKDMNGNDEPVHELQITKKWDDPEPSDPKRPLGAKRYVLFDAAGFVATVQKYGNAENSLVVYDDNYIVALLDATQTENYGNVYDAARMRISNHHIFGRWYNFFQNEQSHEKFLKFIKVNMVDIADGHKLVESWSEVETTVGLKRQAKYDTAYERAFSYRSQTTGKSEKGELICQFEINIPVLEGDAENRMFTFDVDIIEPRDPNDEAKFQLRSRAFETALHDAVRESVELIKTDLADYTVVYGDTSVFWS